MVADRLRFAGMNAVLAILVALALLLAPATGAQVMPCHDGPVHEHSDLEHASVQMDAHSATQVGLHTPDHKNYCAVPCGFCVALTSMNRTEAPIATGSLFRFAWADQTGSGLALPPTLGPPRLPV